MSADRLLAIDVGTQSVRAMVFDPAGNLLARTKVPIEPYVAGPARAAASRTRSSTGEPSPMPATGCGPNPRVAGTRLPALRSRPSAAPSW